VEELTEVNRCFTESLNDAIEIAVDEGDEDLGSISRSSVSAENFSDNF
jgi:hypothetical protein